MEKQHLTYFKIENFKRFDSFEMSNLGQFNLIVGDNNVGKTSVMEGLLFDEDLSQLVSNYFNFLGFRNAFSFENRSISTDKIRETNFWQLIFKDITKPIVISLLGYLNTSLTLILKSNSSLEDAEIEKIRNKVVSQASSLWLKMIDSRYQPDKFQLTGAYLENNEKINSYTAFIPVNLGYENDLVGFFYTYFNSDKERRRELEETLRSFLPKLEEVRVHRFFPDNESLGLIFTDNNETIPLTRFGDGTVKTVRILLEIMLAQGKRLMIDEIGAGIHFTRLKEYWKTIIQLCQKYNVQIFATTHSLECQRAFVEALDEEDMKQYQADARNITLIENPQGEVKAITYDFEQFEYALDIGFNTRGGSL